MRQRMKDQKLTFVLARNQDFAKGERLGPQFKEFYKKNKIGKRGKLVKLKRRLWGFGDRVPSRRRLRGLHDFLLFSAKTNFEKISISITFHMFLEPFERTKFLRFESQLSRENWRGGGRLLFKVGTLNAIEDYYSCYCNIKVSLGGGAKSWLLLRKKFSWGPEIATFRTKTLNFYRLMQLNWLAKI